MDGRYTEGIFQDGAAILFDGDMVPIEDVVVLLNGRAKLRARAEAAEAENERLRVLIESQGRDNTQPCTLGALCPWCYAEALRNRAKAAEAKLAMVKCEWEKVIPVYSTCSDVLESKTAVDNINAIFNDEGGER